MKTAFPILMIFAFVACGEHVWKPVENEQQNQITSHETVDLMPSISEFFVWPGQTLSKAVTIDRNLPAGTTVELAFASRLHTDGFSGGSWALLQVGVNDHPLTMTELKKSVPCYHYPYWDFPEVCHEWFFETFAQDLVCEEEHFTQQNDNLFVLQISPNYENHMNPDNPDKPGENDHAFYVDPEEAGNIYEFRFDITSLVSEGPLTISFGNPMTEYRDFLQCTVDRDNDYWSVVGEGIGEGKIFVNSLKVRATIPVVTTAE